MLSPLPCRCTVADEFKSLKTSVKRLGTGDHENRTRLCENVYLNRANLSDSCVSRTYFTPLSKTFVVERIEKKKVQNNRYGTHEDKRGNQITITKTRQQFFFFFFDAPRVPYILYVYLPVFAQIIARKGLALSV